MEPPGTIPFIIHDDVLTLPRRQGGLMPCPTSPYSCPQRLWWLPDFSEEVHFQMSLGLAALWLSGTTSPRLAWAQTGFTPLPGAGCLTLLLAATPSQKGVNPGRLPHGLQGTENTRCLRLWKVKDVTCLSAPCLKMEKGQESRLQIYDASATCIFSALPAQFHPLRVSVSFLLTVTSGVTGGARGRPMGSP